MYDIYTHIHVQLQLLVQAILITTVWQNSWRNIAIITWTYIEMMLNNYKYVQITNCIYVNEEDC